MSNEPITLERIRELRAAISPAPWKHNGRGRIAINTTPFPMEIVRLPAPSIFQPDTPEDTARMRASSLEQSCSLLS